MKKLDFKKFDLIMKEVEKIILESPISTDLEHAKRTLKWFLVLQPDADFSMQIAAFGHDIDRGISKITNKDLKDMSNYEKDREEHSNRSVQYIVDLLQKYDLDSDIITKIGNVVRSHEVGGDKMSDILKDADSIAYFDYNIPVYFLRNGEEKTRHKIHYMFERTSPRAQEIIRGLKFNDKLVANLMNEELGI